MAGVHYGTGHHQLRKDFDTLVVSLSNLGAASAAARVRVFQSGASFRSETVDLGPFENRHLDVDLPGPEYQGVEGDFAVTIDTASDDLAPIVEFVISPGGLINGKVNWRVPITYLPGDFARLPAPGGRGSE